MSTEEYWNLQSRKDELIRLVNSDTLSTSEFDAFLDEWGELRDKSFELACALGTTAPNIIKNEWDRLCRRTVRIKEEMMMQSEQTHPNDYQRFRKHLERTEAAKVRLRDAVFNSVLNQVATTNEKDSN